MSTETSLALRRLPPLLSLVAGMVDVIGYLGLKLFTAHITGNLVIVAAMLVRGGPPIMDQILAVPVFILAVAAVWLWAKLFKRQGAALTKPLLFIEFLLLSCSLAVSVLFHPFANPKSLISDLTSMITISAMACQFALLRLAVPGSPSTAVMTGNITEAVLSFLDSRSRSEPLLEKAEERLKRTTSLLVGFCAGCLVGAAAFSWIGEWAWALPLSLIAVALALPY